MNDDYRLPDGWIDRMLAAEDPPSEQVVAADKWDRGTWGKMHRELSTLRSSTKKLGKFTPTGRPCMADAFLSFFKVSPELLDPDHIEPSHLVNRLVMSEAHDLAEFIELRRFTQGDDVAAADACVTIEPDLETLFDRQKEMQDKADRLRQAMQDLAEALAAQADVDAMAEEMLAEAAARREDEGRDDSGEGDSAGLSDEEGDELAAAQDAAAATAKAAREAAEAAQEAFSQAMSQTFPDVRASVQDALRKAVNSAQNLAQAGRAFGLDRGQMMRLPAAARMKLAKRLNNPRLRQIIDMFGSMRNTMLDEQQKKVDYARTEVHTITQGDDLPRVLPTELVRLRDPRRKLDFYRDYRARRLMQYELRGTDALDRGGIIMCEDGSYSMKGEREMRAKAFMLCLLDLSRRQKRSFTLIHFGSPGEFKIIRFEKPANYTPERILEAAELFFGGGTDFKTPFTEGVKILAAEFAAEGCTQGDIVFVTDGECKVDDKFQAWYHEEEKRLGFSTWGISIAGGREAEPLFGMCSGRVESVGDLFSGRDVKNLFRGL